MDGGGLQEMERMVRDNNRMLRAMRRNAFIGGILKIIFYVAVLVVLPAWLYITYLAPLAEQAQGVLNQVQGAGTSAQNQLNAFQEVLQKLNPAQYIGQ